jgi:hypothetical protein
MERIRATSRVSSNSEQAAQSRKAHMALAPCSGWPSTALWDPVRRSFELVSGSVRGYGDRLLADGFGFDRNLPYV